MTLTQPSSDIRDNHRRIYCELVLFYLYFYCLLVVMSLTCSKIMRQHSHVSGECLLGSRTEKYCVCYRQDKNSIRGKEYFSFHLIFYQKFKTLLKPLYFLVLRNSFEKENPIINW